MNCPFLIRFCCFSPPPIIHSLLGSCIMISWNYFNLNQIIIRIGNWCLFISPAQFSKFVRALVYVYIHFICLYINTSRYVYQAAKIQAQLCHWHPPGPLLGKKRHLGFLGGLWLTLHVAAFSFVFQSICIVVTSVVRKSFVA